MKNENASNTDEITSRILHRKGKQEVDEEPLSKKEVDEDQSLPQQENVVETSKNWLNWLVGNLTSAAKNVYTYFTNGFFGEPEKHGEEENRVSLPKKQIYEKFPDYMELLKKGQLISNKILEINIRRKETNEYRGDNKEKYIQKLHNILNEPMSGNSEEKQDYLLKIIYATLELEAIYGDAGEAAKEYTENLDDTQEAKLYEGLLYGRKIKDFKTDIFEREFDEYLKRNGIERDELNQNTLNEYKIKWQEETKNEISKMFSNLNQYKDLERIDTETIEYLYQFWKFNDEEGVVEFNGSLEQVEEWKNITENLSSEEEGFSLL